MFDELGVLQTQRGSAVLAGLHEDEILLDEDSCFLNTTGAAWEILGKWNIDGIKKITMSA